MPQISGVDLDDVFFRLLRGTGPKNPPIPRISFKIRGSEPKILIMAQQARLHILIFFFFHSFTTPF